MAATEKSNRDKLKGYFKRNEIPTQENFAELIDGMLNLKDDRIAKVLVSNPSDPKKNGLSIIDTADKRRLFIDQEPGPTPKAVRGTGLVDPFTPTTTLEIRKDADSNLGPILHLLNGAGWGSAAIDFSGYATEPNLPTVRIQSIDDNGGSSHLVFWVLKNKPKVKSTDPQEKQLVETLRITSSGNVGIGTSDPTARLHVSGGDMKLDGRHVTTALEKMCIVQGFVEWNDKTKKCSPTSGSGYSVERGELSNHYIVIFTPAFEKKPSFVVTTFRPNGSSPQDNAVIDELTQSSVKVYTGLEGQHVAHSFSFIAIGPMA